MAGDVDRDLLLQQVLTERALADRARAALGELNAAVGLLQAAGFTVTVTAHPTNQLVDLRIQRDL